MSIASVAHKHAFGLKSDVRGNIHWIDENTVVYPCGANAVIYNSESKTQKFIPVQDGGQVITAMALSPSKRFIAIAERGETATILIYDLLTLRRRKVLLPPTLNQPTSVATPVYNGSAVALNGEGHSATPLVSTHPSSTTHSSATVSDTAKEIVCLCFSSDSKYLVSLSNAPDFILHNWSWEKAKIIGSVKLGSPTVTSVHQVIFNPWDPTQLSILGNGIFRCYRFVEGGMKQFGAYKTEPKV